MTNWQPIDTAPISENADDPILFLGFVPHSCGGYMCVFYWNYIIEDWQNNIDGGVDKPTHWMPLPEPPELNCGD